MSCCGKHKASADVPAGYSIGPAEECILCAEKHLATAYALAMETGYFRTNRPRIIGELTLAQWHLFRSHPALCEAIRGIRHQVQARHEVSITWKPVLDEIDALARKELRT